MAGIADNEVLTLVGGIQTFLFCVAVTCVAGAFVMARRRRRHPHYANSMRGVSFWRGRPGPVKPAVGIGWGTFVLLNTIGGLVMQPVVACGLFMRAYVIRAVCLRRRR